MRAVDLREFRRPAEVKRFFDGMMKDKLAGTGITASAGMFLVELDPDVGISNKELTERVGVTKGLTTRVVGQLTDMGLVTAAPDGRELRIRLTDRGVDAKATVERCATEVAEYLYSGFTDAEIQEMARLYGKIEDAMRRYEASRGGQRRRLPKEKESVRGPIYVYL